MGISKQLRGFTIAASFSSNCIIFQVCYSHQLNIHCLCCQVLALLRSMQTRGPTPGLEEYSLALRVCGNKSRKPLEGQGWWCFNGYVRGAVPAIYVYVYVYVYVYASGSFTGPQKWGGVGWGINVHSLAHLYDVTPRHVHLHLRTYVMLR